MAFHEQSVARTLQFGPLADPLSANRLLGGCTHEKRPGTLKWGSGALRRSGDHMARSTYTGRLTASPVSSRDVIANCFRLAVSRREISWAALI